jgi:hypothetical protein
MDPNKICTTNACQSQKMDQNCIITVKSLYFKHKTHTVHWQLTSLSCGSILEVSYPINVFVRSILSLHLLHKIEVPKVGADITSRRAGQVGGVPVTR